MTTIKELYNTGPTPYNGKEVKNFIKGKTVLPELYIGFELEIENMAGRLSFLPNYLTMHEDGSLRNGGIEIVNKPLMAQHVEGVLTTFFANNKITKDNYSERCSTHIHTNVCDFTIEQIRSIALIYQTVERVLFNFVGNDRANSIFCVPWNQTGITTNFVEALIKRPDRAVAHWQKYTALNLLPILSFGSIEWRHLHGTCDVKLIMNWINIISCIIKYGSEVKYDSLKQEILDMNTVSNYGAFIEGIFGEYTKLLIDASPQYQTALSQGVIDTKLMLLETVTTIKSSSIAPAPERSERYGGLQATFTSIDDFNWDNTRNLTNLLTTNTTNTIRQTLAGATAPPPTPPTPLSVLATGQRALWEEITNDGLPWSRRVVEARLSLSGRRPLPADILNQLFPGN